ncbi:MAG: class I SAM-dependent methyltransferase [Ancrocorticia sp.]|uniref:class I SAM-dependent methyltransferase n=1 Tax=Ancrocorticia sp. TaxID=2593684 RepID=UPI003F8DCCE9
MTAETIRSAYSARSVEYTALLGEIDAMAEEDRRTIASWAATLDGPAVDAGCGPGHWTAFLHALGVKVTGIDLIPEFIDSAAARFPETHFHVGDFTSLRLSDGSLDGILSWYSVIHSEPEQLPVILREFARCLHPGGTLLLGFFEGPRVEPFPHAVVTAYFYPVNTMKSLLERAGFEVLETHARTSPEHRPHGAIVARRLIPT